MEKKLDVVVVGSLITDLICYSERIPKLGETIEGTDFQTGFGGKGANQCVAAARLGATCAFVGKVGSDANGSSYVANMKSEKVDVNSVEIVPNVPTGVASIMVGTSDGQNIIVIVPGANSLVTPEYVKNRGEVLIKKAKTVIVQLEIPIQSSLEALKLSREHNATSIFNVAPAVQNLPKEMFSLPDIICLNESEAELVAGLPKISSRNDAEEAIKKLVSEFQCNNVIITLGSGGAVLWDKSLQRNFHVSTKAVQAIDTTGAGDCFVGTLAYCISRGDDLHTAMQKAVENATDSVLRKGTQSSFPYKLLSE